MNWMRAIRIMVATVVTVSLILLFVVPAGWAAHYFGWAAEIQLLPAVLSIGKYGGLAASVVLVLLIILTWIFGRVYCSAICPLGVMQDVFRRLKIGRRVQYRYRAENKTLRWSILVVFVILLCIPSLAFIARFMDPYSAFGRIVTAASRHALDAAFWTGVVWFAGLGIWSQLRGREYCNTLCPVGTILSLISRVAWLRPLVNQSQCTQCGACEKQCKAEAITPAKRGEKYPTVDMTKCVGCYDCIGNCPVEAIQIGTPYNRGKIVPDESKAPGTDESRRRFLGILGGVAVAATVKAQEVKMDGGLAHIEKKKVPARAIPVRPAGSVSQRHFESHCTACQLCVGACPNKVLRPSQELSRWMQPELQFEEGYCMITCNRCSEVCPTEAITPIQLSDKSSIRTGHAVWIKDNCVVGTDQVACGSCAEHCPTGAITMVSGQSVGINGLIPAVDEEKCIGCGKCEYLCPARPFSAIYVEGHDTQLTL